MVAEQTSRMMWAQLEERRRQQESESQDQGAPASVGGTYYPPPGAAAQPDTSGREVARAPRKPFNWRRVGWILAILAAIWTLGAAYDVATGHASAVGAGVFAAVSAVGAIICFAIPRREDHER